jgi:predicted metalloprotease with PDZ domain
MRFAVAVATIVTVAPAGFHASDSIQYRFTFPEPQHRWMQVEATFPGLPDRPLELEMSRSSPGRYSLHDFAKNVYDVHAYDRGGHEVMPGRPDPSGWVVEKHGGAVRVNYKIYGDVVDGTYLAIDPTHAHINMPAAIMWARGLDDRPALLSFLPPAGVRWQVATQLHAGSTPFEFTAPNLQYLMDSPVEFGPLTIRQFLLGPRTFRFALHHTGTDREFEDYLKDVEKIVGQEGAVFGEYPQYEPGHFTFLADYLPYAQADGMEHRNSTVMTAPGSIRGSRPTLLEAVAHEFFHAWNVERIRPRTLEPFDFERANLSGELWFAEGFTQYYGALVLQRAGLSDLPATAQALTEFVEAVVLGPGRTIRSAEEMSRMAAFTDGERPLDRTNWPNTFISYYQFGAAIALALDLTLRDRSDGRLNLDDYMRAMWRVHGRPGGAREGFVDRPYTNADAEARLAEVSGDPEFAKDFFSRYVIGHEAADYARLLRRAGFIVRPRSPARPWWGDVRLEHRNGRLSVNGPVLANTPLYRAGLDEDDEVRKVDGTLLQSGADAFALLERHKPGDRIRVAYVDHTGIEKTTTVVLEVNPHLEVVPAETVGPSLTATERTFRDEWLGARQIK